MKNDIRQQIKWVVVTSMETDGRNAPTAIEKRIIDTLISSGAIVLSTDDGFEVCDARNARILQIARILDRMISIYGCADSPGKILQPGDVLHLSGHQNLRVAVFRDMPIPGCDYSVFSTLPSIREISCTPQENVQRAIESLGKCVTLRLLTMCYANLKGERLDQLQGLNNLIRLDLNGSGASPSPEFLSSLTALEELNLEGTNVRDDALAVLPRLRRLRRVFIGSEVISDAGVDAIADCASLEVLAIQSKRVSCLELTRLSRIPCLNWLFIRLTVPDQALFESFAMMPRLDSVMCSGAGVSISSRKKLEQILPNVDVTWTNGLLPH